MSFTDFGSMSEGVASGAFWRSISSAFFGMAFLSSMRRFVAGLLTRIRCFAGVFRSWALEQFPFIDQQRNRWQAVSSLYE